MKSSSLSLSPNTINIHEDVFLLKTNMLHAKALFHAIDSNRAHLSKFLPWVMRTNSIRDSKNYLMQSIKSYEQGIELTYNIYKNTRLIGRVGIHQIDHQNNNAAIGYWLIESEQGQGIITNACIILLNFAFENLGFHRIEILTATTNLKSAAIPKRLGFTFEGVLRQIEKHGNIYLDLNSYSLLKNEWLRS